MQSKLCLEKVLKSLVVLLWERKKLFAVKNIIEIKTRNGAKENKTTKSRSSKNLIIHIYKKIVDINSNNDL